MAVGSQLQAPVVLSSGNNLPATPTLGPGTGLVKRKICCMMYLLGCLTLEYGTDKLSQNVGKNYQSALRNIPEEGRPQENLFPVPVFTPWTLQHTPSAQTYV